MRKHRFFDYLKHEIEVKARYGQGVFQMLMKLDNGDIEQYEGLSGKMIEAKLRSRFCRQLPDVEFLVRNYVVFCRNKGWECEFKNKLIA